MRSLWCQWTCILGTLLVSNVCSLPCDAGVASASVETDGGGRGERNQEWERAAEVYRRALQADPLRAELYGRLRALAGRRQGEGFQRDLEERVRRDPRDFVSRNLLGVLYARQRLWSEALREVTAALTIQPRDVDALTNRGWVFSELKMFEAALADFTTALSLRPDYARAYAGRGGIYAEQGQYAHAIEEYTHAVRFDPRHAPHLTDLGWTYYRSGRISEARAVLERAIREDPQDRRAHSHLGWVYLKAGHGEVSQREFEAALTGDSSDAFATFGLGRAFQAQGRYRDAARAYQGAWKRSGNEIYLLALAGAYTREYLVVILVGSSLIVLVIFFALFSRARHRSPQRSRQKTGGRSPF